MKHSFEDYHNFLINLSEDSYPHWNGTFIQKNPLDLWTYIEIIQKVKPSIIIETGTYKGGSAEFFHDIQKQYNTKNKFMGIVITIDNDPKVQIDTSGIIQIIGLSQDSAVIDKVKCHIIKKDTVMISLDAGHTPDEVFTELVNYAPMVTPGSYIVVEDTHLGTIIGKDLAGPSEAVQMFLNTTDDFEVDLNCERFGISYNHGGWLKRKGIKNEN